MAFNGPQTNSLRYQNQIRPASFRRWILTSPSVGSTIGGIAVIAEMRKRRRLRKVPIVAVTAYDSPGLRLEAEKAGVNEYFTKPLHPEQFNTLIDRFLQKW